MTNPTKKKDAPSPEQGSSRGVPGGSAESGQPASKRARRTTRGPPGESCSCGGEIVRSEPAAGLERSPPTTVAAAVAAADGDRPLTRPTPTQSARPMPPDRSTAARDPDGRGRQADTDSLEAALAAEPDSGPASVVVSTHEEEEEGAAEDMQCGASSTISPPKLDWVWSEDSISEACVHVLGRQGAQVFFHQDYSCGTAAARGTLPMAEGQHFWEIHMDSPVYGTAMMLGIGTKQIDLSQYMHTFCHMLGNDANAESCGLSYTGRFFQGGANGRAYCSKFGQGTVIGLHLDMWFGTLTYYKNGKCLGVATKGLLGKVWYPMVSSTAARSSMCLQAARSFPSSLQFWCCRSLRRAVPAERSVLAALAFPPGLRAFLEDNLGWLLEAQARPQADLASRGTQTELSMATHRLSDVPRVDDGDVAPPAATAKPPTE